MPIKTKLFGAFAIVIALMLALGVFALAQMGSIQSQTKDIATNALPSVATVDQVGLHAANYRQLQLQHVAATSDAESRAIVTRLGAERKGLESALRTYRASYLNAGLDTRLYGSVGRQWDAYVKASGGFLALSADNHNDAALAVLNRAAGEFTALQATIDRWQAENRESASAGYAAARSSYATARLIAIICLLVAAAVGAALAFLIGRGVAGGARQMLAAAEGIAAGDVDRRVTLEGRDELGQTADAFRRMVAYLKTMATSAGRMADGDLTVDVEPQSERDALGHAFAGMIASLREMAGQVSDSARSLSASSQQMASTSQEAGRAVGEIATAVGDVAQGAERQVRAIGEARRVSEEMASATQTSAASAQETADAAEQARAVAEEGATAAGQATEAMAAVRESSAEVTAAMRSLGAKSQEIGGILETITGIAEQTNLLALNAAIEAARAGEQGRGFAVVDEEVRKLAEESQQAAASIGALIGEIQGETSKAVTVVEAGAERTADGAGTVEQAREAFQRIGGAVEEMNGRVQQIAVAIDQIASSSRSMQDDIGEVAAVAEQSSAASEQVSASVQETSASTQEIAASADELSRMADELDRLVSRFTLA